ncbi:MAG: Crp/Fnr family transcriptional regulator [Pseudomonadota bacterium]
MLKTRLDRSDVYASAWLKGLTTDAINDLQAITEFMEYENKDTIYAIGGPQQWIWGICSGCVKVLVAMAKMDPVVGHIHHPRAWFGESEPLLGIDGLVEMKAIGQTTVARVPYTKFKECADGKPELWEAYARLCSMNQLLAVAAANDLALVRSEKRIAATLLRLSGQRSVLQGSEASDIVHANQQEVATLANISLSKASGHLNKMAREGFIDLRYGHISILDPRGLQTVIGD